MNWVYSYSSNIWNSKRNYIAGHGSLPQPTFRWWMRERIVKTTSLRNKHNANWILNMYFNASLILLESLLEVWSYPLCLFRNASMLIESCPPKKKTEGLNISKRKQINFTVSVVPPGRRSLFEYCQYLSFTLCFRRRKTKHAPCHESCN